MQINTPTPKILFITCPDCDHDIPADQNLKQRPLTGKLSHVNEVYVQCPSCNVEHHQFYTTAKIIRLRQQADKLASIQQLLASRNPNLEEQVVMVSQSLGVGTDEARERMLGEVSRKFELARKRFDVANRNIQEAIAKNLKNAARRERRQLSKNL